jgi:O-antigen ligase
MDFGGGAGDRLEDIPILHNGYVYILIKSGAIGLAIYLAFMWALYRRGRAHARSSDPIAAFSGMMIITIAAAILLTTSVITGIYNKGGLIPLMFLLGSFLCATSGYARRRTRIYALVPVPGGRFRNAL